jgi:hypothetical protein
VEGMNGIFWALWDKEEGMEGMESGVDVGQSQEV